MIPVCMLAWSNTYEHQFALRQQCWACAAWCYSLEATCLSDIDNISTRHMVASQASSFGLDGSDTDLLAVSNDALKVRSANENTCIMANASRKPSCFGHAVVEGLDQGSRRLQVD